MTYQERWLLAVATSQPYPQFYATGLILVPGEAPPPNQPTYSLAEVMARRDTGDVAPSSSSSSSGLTYSASEVKTAFEQLRGAARLLLAIGTGLGLIVGGAIGYGVGKSKS